MNSSELIKQTVLFVKESLENAEGGHDWFHIERVWKNAQLIAREESDVNLLVIELGALLHDIADAKFHHGDETLGPTLARTFLQSQQVDETVINHVVLIIENVSFKGGNFKQAFNSKELAIIQDADRLDAIGAIGIARAFNYGGFKNRALYNPEIKPNLNQSKEDYKNNQAPTLNHFYEKLLLLKDKMNTATGKKIAKNRHQFMETYLQQFYDEWNGKI